MNKMIAFCSLDCSVCPAFIATQADDYRKRTETARIWSEQYHADIKPEDINCDGCISRSGRLFNYPRVCEIRKCSIDKQILNCAHCPEYACEKLAAFFALAPQAKENLDRISKEL